MALQTGTIDGALANYDGLRMMKLDEAAPNLLVSKELWYALPFLHIVNARRFERLPMELRQALLRTAAMAEKKFADTYDAAFEALRAEQVADGYTVTDMSPEDLARWENREALARLQSEWVTEAESAGLANAGEIMAEVKAIHRQAIQRGASASTARDERSP